jgi:hypothetical protein
MRRITCDFLKIAKAIPTVPVQRRMHLAEVVAARNDLPERPSWVALFTKAYARVASRRPELRRAYVKFPWSHLYEYPVSVASIAIEREFQGELGVLLAKIKDPTRLSVFAIHELLRKWKETPIDQNKEFRRALWLSRIPWPIRPLLWWLGLNVARQRGNFFGTFTVSVYSGLGAESLHPLTPTTTTLNYGIIEPDGTVNVRIIYDHRVMDGATVARALEDLEGELRGDILAELKGSLSSPRQAA